MTLLWLGLALLAAGCYVPASTRLVHPETGDVRYCWQHTVFIGGQVAGDTTRNEPCIREWERHGYVIRPNEPVR